MPRGPAPRAIRVPIPIPRRRRQIEEEEPPAVEQQNSNEQTAAAPSTTADNAPASTEATADASAPTTDTPASTETTSDAPEPASASEKPAEVTTTEATEEPAKPTPNKTRRRTIRANPIPFAAPMPAPLSIPIPTRRQSQSTSTPAVPTPPPATAATEAPSTETVHREVRESTVDSTREGSVTSSVAGPALQFPLIPHRGRRERSLSPVDSEEREIDVEKMTMAELCRDIHIGRKTDNYDKLKQIKQEAKDQKRRALYENPEDREKRIKLENEQEAERRKRAAELVDKGLGNNSAAGRANGVAALRVVNGKIEVDQDSLLVDRHAIADAERTTEEREVDSDLKRVVNSASWSRRERVERWSAAETVKFYNSLSMWGTDFGLIVQMFPGRSRRQIKNKFNAEERKNPARIHTALTSRIPVGKDYVDNAMKSESKEAENAASSEDTQRAGSEQPPYTDPTTAPPAAPSSVSEPVVIAD